MFVYIHTDMRSNGCLHNNYLLSSSHEAFMFFLFIFDLFLRISMLCAQQSCRKEQNEIRKMMHVCTSIKRRQVNMFVQHTKNPVMGFYFICSACVRASLIYVYIYLLVYDDICTHMCLCVFAEALWTVASQRD